MDERLNGPTNYQSKFSKSELPKTCTQFPIGSRTSPYKCIIPGGTTLTGHLRCAHFIPGAFHVVNRTQGFVTEEICQGRQNCTTSVVILMLWKGNKAWVLQDSSKGFQLVKGIFSFLPVLGISEFDCVRSFINFQMFLSRLSGHIIPNFIHSLSFQEQKKSCSICRVFLGKDSPFSQSTRRLLAHRWIRSAQAHHSGVVPSYVMETGPCVQPGIVVDHHRSPPHPRNHDLARKPKTWNVQCYPMRVTRNTSKNKPPTFTNLEKEFKSYFESS